MIILWSVRTAHKKKLEVVFNKPVYLFGNKAGDAWKMHKFLLDLSHTHRNGHEGTNMLTENAKAIISKNFTQWDPTEG